jgi:hypothetical protein
VAERVGLDVDAADRKTIALHRREGSIVPDDLGDRIRRRHVASSAIVRHEVTLTRLDETRALAAHALLESSLPLGFRGDI